VFTAQVIGDPAAAIHDVWVTYTGDGGSGAWTVAFVDAMLDHASRDDASRHLRRVRRIRRNGWARCLRSRAGSSTSCRR
jgi:hypothetical protein